MTVENFMVFDVESIGLHGEPVEEEDLCLSCDGNGWKMGAEFETDMDGAPLPANP